MGAAVAERHDGLNWFAFASVEKFSADQSDWALRQMHPKVHRIGTDPRASFRGVYNADLARLLRKTGSPEDGVREHAGNLLVTEGLAIITNLITAGGSGFALTNTKGLCTVGDSSTAASVSDTYVTATFTSTTNCYQNVFDATFPSVSNGVITGQSTYGTSVANFAWNTWGWASFNGTAAASATLSTHGTSTNNAQSYNHKVPASSLGTKASGASWVFTTTITLS